MFAYVYMNHMGWGWGILMTLTLLALLGLFATAVLASLRNRGSTSSREILDRRLAAGEIDVDNYERAREAMSRPDRRE